MKIEDRLSKRIQSMSREKFERLCIDLLERMGFQISTVKSIGGDIQVEASIERDDEKKDYVVNCSRATNIEREVRKLEEMVDENIQGFIITHQRVNERIDSNVEVAGVENFYKLLDKFHLLNDLDLREESIQRDEISNMMDEARKTLNEEEPKKAIDKIIEIIKKDENFKQSWLLLSKAYKEIDSYKNEIDALEQALNIDDGYVEAWKAKGDAHYRNSDYDEAISCFERLLEIEPESPETWNNIGLCYMKKGELDEALNSINNALSIDDRFVQALMNKALIFEKQGKIKKTTEVSKKLTEIEPDNPEYQYIHAAYLYKKDDYKRSLERINKVLEFDPDHKEAERLKNILEQQIKIEKTDEMIRENVKLSEHFDPIKRKRLSEVLWRLDENKEAIKYVNEDNELTGCIFFEEGNLDKAKDIFDKNREEPISSLNLEEVDYQNGDLVDSKNILNELNGKVSNISIKEKKGISLKKLGDLDSAIDIFEDLIENYEGLEDVLEERFRCLIKKNSSVEDIESDLAITDKNRLYNLFSILHFINNNYEESIELLEKVTDIKNPIYFNNLGCILYNMDRFEDALNAFKRAIDNYGETPVYLNNYSFCLLEEDKLEEALENLEKSLDIDRNNPITWYYKGIVLKRKGEDNWQESIEESLDIDPDFKEAKRLLE